MPEASARTSAWALGWPPPDTAISRLRDVVDGFERDQRLAAAGWAGGHGEPPRARVRAGQAGGPERRAPGDLRGLRGAAQGVAGGEGGGGATRSAARGRSRRGREPCLEHPQPLVGFCGFSLVVGWAPAFSVLVLPVPCSVLCQCWPMDCRRYIPGTSKMPVIVMSRSGSLGTTTRALQRFESPEKRSKSVRNFVDGPSQKRVPVRHQVSH